MDEKSSPTPNLELLLDVRVQLSIELGSCQMRMRDVLQLNRIAGARDHAVAFNKYPLVWIAPIQLLRVRGNPNYRAVIVDEGIGTGARGRWEFGLMLDWNISLWHRFPLALLWTKPYRKPVALSCVLMRITPKL